MPSNVDSPNDATKGNCQKVIVFLISCCNPPSYRVETLVNGYNDTLYSVQRCRVHYMSDTYYFEEVYAYHDRHLADSVYKSKMKEYEEGKRRQYK